MSFAVSTGSSFMYSMMKANIQYQLMSITRQIDALLQQSMTVSDKYQKAMQQALQPSSDTDSSLNLDGSFLSFDPEMAIIQAKEKMLDNQKQQLETQLQEVTAMSDSNDKLISDDVKIFGQVGKSSS